ncbi:transmembrane protein 234 isoform X1 [Motacilla alba alba]|uniref:transmembrane protein 234 isoform X1 n=1 Tax=Motacilla alba alba TaxID=1094192 RepID=UPI0018D59D03|nr:transmembrane protein 234 isoform X1 [Motacilla alba alba]
MATAGQALALALVAALWGGTGPFLRAAAAGVEELRGRGRLRQLLRELRFLCRNRQVRDPQVTAVQGQRDTETTNSGRGGLGEEVMVYKSHVSSLVCGLSCLNLKVAATRARTPRVQMSFVFHTPFPGVLAETPASTVPSSAGYSCSIPPSPPSWRTPRPWGGTDKTTECSKTNKERAQGFLQHCQLPEEREEQCWAVGGAQGRIQPCQREKHQPGLEFANPGGGGGHIHGLLPSSQHHLQGQEAEKAEPLGAALWDSGNAGLTELGKTPGSAQH